MKIATVVVRVLMGLLFLFSSITYLFGLIQPPPPTGAMKTFNEGLEASVYLLPTVKVVEFLAPEGLPIAAFLALANGFLAWRPREAYRPLLRP